MSRIDYDTIFYRIFCATVLGIAFTFTVILTNVFIDIDGLLSKKGDATTESPHSLDDEVYKTDDGKNEVQYNDEPNDDEIDSYRGKRSIEPDNFLFQVKNPNIKKILTNKLAKLLEELDEEESTKRSVVNEVKGQVDSDMNDVKNERDKLDESGNDNMLHLAMHNILLQGIIGHMDLNDVYKKVHKLIKNFDDHIKPDTTQNTVMANSKEVTENKLVKTNEESKFFDELLKCKTLQNQITDVKNEKPKLFIKTIIEISENRKAKKENDSNSKDVVGLIKLIYNGKSVKFEKMEDTETIDNKQSSEQLTSTQNTQIFNENVVKLNSKQRIEDKPVSNPDWNKIFKKYIKEHSINNDLGSDTERKNSKSHREKRQIKIHYGDRKITTSKPKSAQKIKKDDEELYIEIETHFDGKGIKGEKKKKLVRNLIDKIQKAIHEDNESIPDKTKMLKHIKVKKRNQDPIKLKNDFFFGNIVPALRNIEHRQTDPIGKILSPIKNILDNYGSRLWSQNYTGPAFLSEKSVNSAEMRELSINYDSMKNGIPTREQKPINIENNGIATNLEDMSNVTFYLKDIDGSGFSVGFNQYVDEPPDMDSLKLFNGLDNIIQEYHKTYDDGDSYNKIDKIANVVDESQYIKREQESIKNSHDISRRSVNDYSSNLYKTLFNKVAYPWNFYKHSKGNAKYVNNLYKNKRSHKFPYNINVISKPIKINNLSVAFINNFYNAIPQNNIDNLFKRKKRSLNVKKISNLKSKIKLSRFINTKTMINKRIFKNSKRNKRQVNKIRIIARDRTQLEKNSNEDIFVISPNNLYSRRKTSAKENTPDIRVDENGMQNVDSVPFTEFLNLNYPNQPIFHEDERIEPSVPSISKYPHMFFEELQRSKEYSNEEEVPMKPYRIQARTNRIQKTATNTENNLPAFTNVKLPGVDDIVNAILPQKPNYRVTVKISPKNKTEVHSGFKEVHTSVNKSFDRNGLRYFSLLNVSQISKIENLNETLETVNLSEPRRNVISSPPLNNEIKEKEKQMNLLFMLHKKRIDTQLDNLKKEKTFLERLLDNKKGMETNIKQDDINHNFNEADRFIDLLREIENPHKPIPITTIKPTTYHTELQTNPVDIIKKPIDIIKADTEKTILIDPIKYNENFTKEILKKIDVNTDLLRKFLQKLSHSLEATTEVSTTNRIKDTIDWKTYSPNNQLFRQLSDYRNASQNIPYVYSFPQPIQANPLPKIKYNLDEKLPSATLPSPDKNYHIRRNQSRFFIDDLEDYNTIVSATIKINTTHL